METFHPSEKIVTHLGDFFAPISLSGTQKFKENASRVALCSWCCPRERSQAICWGCWMPCLPAPLCQTGERFLGSMWLYRKCLFRGYLQKLKKWVSFRNSRAKALASFQLYWPVRQFFFRAALRAQHSFQVLQFCNFNMSALVMFLLLKFTFPRHRTIIFRRKSRWRKLQ